MSDMAHEPPPPGWAEHAQRLRQYEMVCLPLEGFIAKQYTFRADGFAFSLPPAHTLFSEPAHADAELMAMKRRLNYTKNKLNGKDKNVWGKHTRSTNLAGRVVPVLRERIAGEMVTIAWAKMYEMIVAYQLAPPDAVRAGRVHSLHVCEAPGAFICAFNHFMRTHTQAQWDWRALTLNPYFEGNNLKEMIDDDKFIVNSREHWYFGRDNSGNIMKRENIEGVWDEMRRVGPVHVVTGDGSIDCQDDPNEQEMTVAQLHYCEVVCAIGALARGGKMVIKMFTLFEHPTVSLLYFLGCVFETVRVCKPATSKQGNSETYIVAEGFTGLPDDYREALLQRVGRALPANAFIPHSHVPAAFMAQMRKCAAYFADMQQAVIERNLRLDVRFQDPDRTTVRRMRERIAEDFIKLFDVRPLHRSRMIAPHARLTGRNNNTTQRGPGGSNDSRHGRKRMRDAVEGGGGGPGSTRSTAGPPPGAYAPKPRGKLPKRFQMIQFVAAKDKAAARVGGDKDDDGDDGGGGVGGGVGAGESGAGKRVRVAAAPPTPGVSLSEQHRLAEEERGKVGANHDAVYSGVGAKLMEQMGHSDGAGLGAKKQGITAPVAATIKRGRGGLGFGTAVRSLGVDASDEGDDAWLLNAHGRPPSADVVAGKWKAEEGAAVALVQTSKWCSSGVLSDLLTARRESLLLARREQLRALASKVETGYAMGKLFFVGPDAVKLARLDHTMSIVKEAANEMGRVTFVDLCGGDGAFAEYVCWRKKRMAQGWVFVHAGTTGYDVGAFNRESGGGKALAMCTAHSGSGVVADADAVGAFARHVRSIERAGVSLALCDAWSVPREGSDASAHVWQENAQKWTLLGQVLAALQTLRKGGSLVLRTGDLFTRFSASVVRVLHDHFGRVRITQASTGFTAEEERFVVCKQFLGTTHEVVDALTRVLRMRTTLAPGRDVMGFVDWSLLTTNEFLGTLLRVNDNLGARQTRLLRALDEYERDASSVPDIRDTLVEQGLRLAALPAELQNAHRDPVAFVRAVLVEAGADTHAAESVTAPAVRDVTREALRMLPTTHSILELSDARRGFLVGTEGGATNVVLEGGLVRDVSTEYLPENTVLDGQYFESSSPNHPSVFHLLDALYVEGVNVCALPHKQRLAHVASILPQLRKRARQARLYVRAKCIFEAAHVERVATAIAKVESGYVYNVHKATGKEKGAWPNRGVLMVPAPTSTIGYAATWRQSYQWVWRAARAVILTVRVQRAAGVLHTTLFVEQHELKELTNAAFVAALQRAIDDTAELRTTFPIECTFDWRTRSFVFRRIVLDSERLIASPVGRVMLLLATAAECISIRDLVEAFKRGGPPA